MAKTAHAAAPVIHAKLNYYEPGDEKPFRLIYTPGPGERETNATYRAVVMPVADIRAAAVAPDLDREGYAIVEIPSVVRHFDNEIAIRTAYYAQSEAIVQRATGAARVVTFDHTIRRAVPDAARLPVTRVHNDYTEISGPQRVRDLMGDEAEALLKKRFAIVNLWRPIGHPVEDAPLAIATADSVALDDFVAQDLIYRDRVGETYLVRHAPQHRWAYVSRQRPEEAMLIKCYDSALDGRARFTAHSAFIDPHAPVDARPRESIEIRTLAFFDA